MGVLLDLLEFAIVILFLRVMARSLGSLFGAPRVDLRTSGGVKPPARPTTPHRGEMERDPVCGMFVATEVSLQWKRGNQIYHFCSHQCLEQYQKDAEHAAS